MYWQGLLYFVDNFLFGVMNYLIIFVPRLMEIPETILSM